MITVEVNLYLYGADLNPDTVTGVLGINPTFASRRGETRTTSTGKMVVQKTGVWGYSISVRSEDLNGSMRSLLEQLVRALGNREEILQCLPMAETGFIEILFSMISDKGSVGCEVELSTSEVKALCSFGLPLRLTLLASPPD